MINATEILLFLMLLLSTILFALDKKQHKDYEEDKKND